MKVRELIEQLAQYKNQDAELNFIVNTIDVDDEKFDIDCCDIELWQHELDLGVYDILVFNKAVSK